ncbi:MAG: N-carbamoylputrescine amidase [Hyphomonadaceae bacterium]|jgi:N-carbamoylputrescine amidase|uniref:N-carbamoylputrescine amidase n=1 Tax=Aquidulcibacter sp. TaxID=2052990 RepID=UPI0022BEB82D|nr:N-carbamoylputrescine amidase [Aquidulcibacter sp.]MCE2891121.1 N-carbamoylputrescine amidase [Hyphomonadaceae bacterium]MCZ8208143.1 N-carbamoylputrescine amidase [Aquidulcibacter sp.]
MSRLVNLAALQTHYGSGLQDNIDRTIALIRQAAAGGAQIILPSELFQGPYFCTTQDERWFATAYPALEHPCVTQLQPVAAELGVVIPVSIFEREGPRYYNSVVILDADGTALGTYRKSHIPDGPGYQEKYYFRPGDAGFKVWNTRFAKIGVGICWDQWYPEAARAMALLGAEVLFYPTAIGSEPHDGTLDTRDPWRRAMQGHAVSNVIPVVAANRIGVEKGLGDDQYFYGSSFIADHRGDLISDLSRTDEGIATGTVDLTFLDRHRAAWGFFRDRRPDLYAQN